MENIGSLALLLAFCIAIYAIAGSVVGRIRRKPFLILSGEHQNRRRHPVLPHFCANIVATHYRQHQIQDDQVRLLLTNHAVAVAAVRRSEHLIGLRSQRKGESTQNCRVVFDHYDSIHGSQSTRKRDTGCPVAEMFLS